MLDTSCCWPLRGVIWIIKPTHKKSVIKPKASLEFPRDGVIHQFDRSLSLPGSVNLPHNKRRDPWCPPCLPTPGPHFLPHSGPELTWEAHRGQDGGRRRAEHLPNEWRECRTPRGIIHRTQSSPGEALAIVHRPAMGTQSVSTCASCTGPSTCEGHLRRTGWQVAPYRDQHRKRVPLVIPQGTC